MFKMNKVEFEMIQQYYTEKAEKIKKEIIEVKRNQMFDPDLIDIQLDRLYQYLSDVESRIVEVQEFYGEFK